MHNSDVQRNDDWHEERLGIPTASRYSDLLTEPRSKADKEAGKMSETSMSYALDLISEMLTGQRKEFSSNATDWGNFYEPFAIEAYTELTGNDVMECGFVRHKEIATGASPDGLVGLDGAIEVKCPYNSSVHLKNKLSGEVPKEYYSQVQGQIFVLDVEWVDFVSFDPRMDAGSAGFSSVRIYRDDEYIKNLEKKIVAFNDNLAEMYNKLTEVKF